MNAIGGVSSVTEQGALVELDVVPSCLVAGAEMELVVRNTGSVWLLTGRKYHLERKDRGHWIDIGWPADVFWTLEGIGVGPRETWTQRTYVPLHLTPGPHRASKQVYVDDDMSVSLTANGTFDVLDAAELHLPRRWNVVIDARGVHDPRTRTRIRWREVAHVTYLEDYDQISVAPRVRSGLRSISIAAINRDGDSAEILAAIERHTRTPWRTLKRPDPAH